MIDPSAHKCPICLAEVERFMPFKGAPHSRQRANAKCPSCGSLERHRLVWLYLLNETDLFSRVGVKRMLHVAPEPALFERLRSHADIDYVSADLNPTLAEVEMDVTAIQYPDASFDVVCCNHVLEHVADDRRAMREFRRVLRPTGWAILQVPVIRDRTDEAPSVTDPAERQRRFGQFDHVRAYGRDYRERLEEAGFEVRVDGYAARLGKEATQRYGLQATEDVYYCRPAHVEKRREEAPGRAAGDTGRAKAETEALRELDGIRRELQRLESVAQWLAQRRGHRRMEIAVAHVPARAAGVDVLRREIFTHLLETAVPRGRTLVDLGAGPCILARLARDSGYSVTAVDVRTERVPPPEELAGVVFVASDAREFDVSGYDVISILGLLYHLTLADQEHLLTRCNNGAVVILDTQVYDPAILPEAAQSWGRRRLSTSDYEGVEFPEGDNPMASVGNATSFWHTEPSLLRLFENAGYARATLVEPVYESKYGSRRFYVLEGRSA